MERIVEGNIYFNIDFLLKIFLGESQGERSKNKQTDENHLPDMFFCNEVNHNFFYTNRFPFYFSTKYEEKFQMD